MPTNRSEAFGFESSSCPLLYTEIACRSEERSGENIPKLQLLVAVCFKTMTMPLQITADAVEQITVYMYEHTAGH